MADINETSHDDNRSEQGINPASRDAGTVNQTARAGNQSARDGSQGEHPAEPSAKQSKGGRPRRTAARVITPAGKRGRPRKAKPSDTAPKAAEKPASTRKASAKTIYLTDTIADFRRYGDMLPGLISKLRSGKPCNVKFVDFQHLPAKLQKDTKDYLTGMLGKGVFTLTDAERHDAIRIFVAKECGANAEFQKMLSAGLEELYQYIAAKVPPLGTAYIRQGVGTNALTKIHKKRFAMNGYTIAADTSPNGNGQLIQQGRDVIDRAIITFNGSADILPPAGMKILIILTIKAVKNLHEVDNERDFLELIARASVVQTTVKEIARLLKNSNLDYVRKLIIDTITALEKIWTKFNDTIDEHGHHTDKPVPWETAIIQAHTPGKKIIQHGIVNVMFAAMYMKYLYGCSGADYPLVLLTIDVNRDPLAWPIGNKLFELSRIRKTEHIIIAFDTLAHSCRSMKQYDEFDKQDKAQGYQRLIVMPVENALDALRDTYHYILDWKYTGKNGRELTDAETLGDRLPYRSKVDSFTGVGERNISITLNPTP